MKKLIKRLLFSFMLLISCPFFMMNASPHPSVQTALSDLHEQRAERAQNNVKLEATLKEMHPGKKNAPTKKINNKNSQSPNRSIKATAPTPKRNAQATAPTPKRNSQATALTKAAPKKTSIKPVRSATAFSATAPVTPFSSRQDKTTENRVVYGPTKKNSAKDEMVKINDKLFVSVGDSNTESDDRMSPTANPLPGGRHTLSQMDAAEQIEATALYRLDQKNSARLQINKNDENSPLYTPRPYDRELTSAGIFVDMDVREDLKFEFGGQRRSLQDATGRFPNGFTDSGASLGFKYSF